MRGWAAEAAWLVIALLLALIIGSTLGAYAFGLLVVLVPWLVWRIRDLYRFDTWLNHSIGRPPLLQGLPEDLSYRLWRLRRDSRQRLRRITRTLRELQQATEALPDAAVLLDDPDTIAWFNRASSELLGLRQQDRGHALSGLLRNPGIVALLHKPGEEGVLEMASPLRESRSLDVRLIGLANSRRLLLARDITQVTKLRTMRQDFIANVSHELRTPLTVILGYLEALEGDADAELVRDTLLRLQRPAQRMKTLVEDLLLLSGLDTGGPIAPERFSIVPVASMLRRITSEAQSLSPEKHRLELEADPELRLLAIEGELHSALNNLVVNAIRYSPDGGTIKIKWSAEGTMARFSVTDPGMGIAAEHIPRLTERFYRIDVGRSRDAGGTGLGLAIVKHVLRRHDSEIEVASEPGRGSRFSCRFPPERVIRVAAPPCE